MSAPEPDPNPIDALSSEIDARVRKMRGLEAGPSYMEALVVRVLCEAFRILTSGLEPGYEGDDEDE